MKRSLTVTYDVAKPQGQRVITAKVGGETLSPDQWYTVATNNFISLGRTYTQLSNVPEENQFSACDEAIIRFVQKGEDSLNTAATKVSLSEASTVPSDDSSQNSSDGNESSVPSTPDESFPGVNPPETGENAIGFFVLIPLACAVTLALSKKRHK